MQSIAASEALAIDLSQRKNIRVRLMLYSNALLFNPLVARFRSQLLSSSVCLEVVCSLKVLNTLVLWQVLVLWWLSVVQRWEGPLREVSLYTYYAAIVPVCLKPTCESPVHSQR